MIPHFIISCKNNEEKDDSVCKFVEMTNKDITYDSDYGMCTINGMIEKCGVFEMNLIHRPPSNNIDNDSNLLTHPIRIKVIPERLKMYGFDKSKIGNNNNNNNSLNLKRTGTVYGERYETTTKRSMVMIYYHNSFNVRIFSIAY